MLRSFLGHSSLERPQVHVQKAHVDGSVVKKSDQVKRYRQLSRRERPRGYIFVAIGKFTFSIAPHNVTLIVEKRSLLDHIRALPRERPIRTTCVESVYTFDPVRDFSPVYARMHPRSDAVICRAITSEIGRVRTTQSRMVSAPCIPRVIGSRLLTVVRGQLFSRKRRKRSPSHSHAKICD